MNEKGIETNSTDAPAVRITVDPQVSFSMRDAGGTTSYVAHYPRTGKYFRLGLEEYHVATLLDGTRTIEQAHQQMQIDGLAWTPEDIAKFASVLVQQRLASADTPPSDLASESPDAGNRDTPSSWTASLPKYLSLVVSQRIPLIDGDPIARRWLNLFGPVFSLAGIIVWSVLVVSGLLIVYGHFDQFADEMRRLFDPGIWPVLIGFWCVAKIFHEMGHAICARRHGVQVGKMGIMFFLLAPLAYVDVTDAWKIQSRMKRVQIALAGVYVELAIAALAAWAWWILPPGLLKHLAAQIFVVAGPTTLLVNANPLLRLDGYYVVSDMLEIPNLRMHGRAQLGRRIEWLLLGIQSKPSLLVGWRRPTATFHALCSVIFQFFWMGGLIFAVSMWAKGLGIVIALAAFLLWAALPLIRWSVKIWKLAPGDRYGLNSYRRRMIGFAALVLSFVPNLFLSASPLDRRVPVIVRFQDEQIARATTDAFVTAVYVTGGQEVSCGMLLMELSQPQLSLSRNQLADEVALAEQSAVLHRRRRELAQAASETENAASLRRQLAELDEQLAGLKVIAQRDGLVTTTNPQRLAGKYVMQGEELIRVCDPREKELLAMVAQRDVEAYRKASAQSSVSSVRLRGGTTFTTSPQSLRPRARRTLPHPSLSAAVGGPLAVEPSTDPNEPLRLIEPQLESVTPLDIMTSKMTRAGQIGTMTIADDRSLIARVWNSLLEVPHPR